MAEQGLRRPTQVTVAGVMGIAGSLLLVIALFDAMSLTRSVEARESLGDLLTEPFWDDVGITVDQMLRLIRYGLFALGAAGAIAFVLAIYIFQRNNAARIGFTVAAVVALPGLFGPTSVGFGSVLLAVAAVGLWSPPSRDWFSGRPTAALALDGSRSVPPRSVATAVLITRACCTVTAFALLVMMSRMLVQSADFKAEVESQLADNELMRDFGFTVDQLVVGSWIALVGLFLWAVGALVISYYVQRGDAWARILLTISSVGTAGLSLVLILGLLPIFTLAAAVITVRLLYTPSASEWFR